MFVFKYKIRTGATSKYSTYFKFKYFYYNHVYTKIKIQKNTEVTGSKEDPCQRGIRITLHDITAMHR